jgi:tRNA (guanine37-N1)-methyltransferase
MSYCRWSEGDLYAYRSPEGSVVHVAARCLGDVRELYTEKTAHALLARILWLGSKGCDYPWDALRHLKEDIIAEVEEQTAAARVSA